MSQIGSDLEIIEKFLGFCFLCCTETSMVCQNCDKVWYCSTDHLELHCPNDSDCFPYEVAVDLEKGRILIATKDIQPGELIFRVNLYIFKKSVFQVNVQKVNQVWRVVGQLSYNFYYNTTRYQFRLMTLQLERSKMYSISEKT